MVSERKFLCLIFLLFNLFVLMPAIAAECGLIAVGGSKVDGNLFWNDVKSTSVQAVTTCDVDQFAWNNFLYLTTDEGGKPRFMSLTPWFDAFPSSGKPKVASSYTKLNNKQMKRSQNKGQAGDDFSLLDVARETIVYDLRVNDSYANQISSNDWYKLNSYNKEVINYINDGQRGIWLNPTSPTSTNAILEIKTSWRKFSASNCPTDIMHCEKDDAGTWWGLIGMHLVQKTPTHGEMIWASFEHVGNSPDCTAGGNNPITQNPGSINVNKNIAGLKDKTGWSLFNYATYTSDGGDGKKCTYPTTGTGGTQCLGDPTTGNKINICRTDQLPPATNCSNATSNLHVTSCLNKNVQAALSNKWKYYQLIGAEWGIWGAIATGAPLSGCFVLKDKIDGQDFGSTCAPPLNGSENTVTTTGTVNLANSTMETWMQKGIKLKVNNVLWTGQDCFSCHQPPTNFGQGDLSHMFGRIQQVGDSSFTMDVNAGPIWDDNDAPNKCKNACATVAENIKSNIKINGVAFKHSATVQWNGQWTTTQEGVMSVCGCTVTGPSN